jgi:wyosine [tRNA(Phe)-imidazoG37] synthetase (radical SAM superfamily)
MCDNWKREIVLNFTHNDLLKIILTLKKYYNCNYIRFHGQEPTMYQKLEELIVFSKKLEMKTSIKTNAWLLNDKRLLKIIPYLDELYLSID